MADHFQRHGPELGLTTEAAYLAAAIELFVLPTSPTVWECVRASGDFVRYDTVTQRFGVLSRDGVIIKSLYFPTPGHGETRRDYFDRQCGR